MHLLRTLSGLALLALTAQAQDDLTTPPNYAPSSTDPLRVAYTNGTTVIEPNDLVWEAKTCNEPTIGLLNQADTQQKYMVVLLDVSLNKTYACSKLSCNNSTTAPYSNTTAPYSNGTTTPAALGLEPGRTTYLHWFQADLTQNYAGGLLSSSSDAIAPYVAPSPQLGDIAHTFVFYLFEQPEGFVLDAGGKDLKERLTGDRIGFDVRSLGDVRAAMFFREQGTNNGTLCD